MTLTRREIEICRYTLMMAHNGNDGRRIANTHPALRLCSSEDLTQIRNLVSEHGKLISVPWHKG